jgi:fructokinase
MIACGGIETGGSKWDCAVGNGPDDLRATETIATTTPEETIGRAVAFFEREGPVEAIRIGSFGPIDQKLSSTTWGYITTTPKPGWAHADVITLPGLGTGAGVLGAIALAETASRA